MDDFESEATDWRREVDSVMDDAMASLRSERSQIEASAGQQASDAANGAAALQEKLGAAVAGLNGTDITAFGDDLVENANSMGDLNEIRAAADGEHVGNLA